MENKTAYPLCWPDHKPRCFNRATNSHFKTAFTVARYRAKEQIRMLGGSELIISTNIPLKNNGDPYATKWGELLPDPGVAIYFQRKGKAMCFACDRWRHVQDNMHAIALTIEALRGIARWGTGDMMEAAFTGFLALPPPSGNGSDPFDTLGIPKNSSWEQVKDTWRNIAKAHHPDTSGSDGEFFKVAKQAYEQIERLMAA